MSGWSLSDLLTLQALRRTSRGVLTWCEGRFLDDGHLVGVLRSDVLDALLEQGFLELHPGEDRGTAVTVGLTANRFELVNTFYVPFDEDDDQVSPVIARAMALLADHGPLPNSAPEPGSNKPKPDHLADIHAVLRGQARVRTQVVLDRLAEHNPAEYADWTFQHLAEALAAEGLTARKSAGVMVVRAANIALALSDRDDEPNGDNDGA